MTTNSGELFRQQPLHDQLWRPILGSGNHLKQQTLTKTNFDDQLHDTNSRLRQQTLVTNSKITFMQLTFPSNNYLYDKLQQIFPLIINFNDKWQPRLTINTNIYLRQPWMRNTTSIDQLQQRSHLAANFNNRHEQLTPTTNFVNFQLLTRPIIYYKKKKRTWMTKLHLKTKLKLFVYYV